MNIADFWVFFMRNPPKLLKENLQEHTLKLGSCT